MAKRDEHKSEAREMMSYFIIATVSVKATGNEQRKCTETRRPRSVLLCHYVNRSPRNGCRGQSHTCGRLMLNDTFNGTGVAVGNRHARDGE